MSVILQSFLHNPLLRAFFLSDRHNRDLCTLSTPTKPCISCEMDRLYSEVSKSLILLLASDALILTILGVICFDVSVLCCRYSSVRTYEFYVFNVAKLE